MSEEQQSRREVKLYIDHAYQMLVVAESNRNNGFYASAVKRAYYAANAILSTQNLARGKHSGVISAFRQHFVKTGLIEPEFSDIYGLMMDHRHVSDYELDLAITEEQAKSDVFAARRFVERIESWLKQEKWV